MLPITLAGEEVELLARRAMWWPAERTLFVADVHLGKASTFKALGLPLADGLCASIARADLIALSLLINRLDARQLIILGDLLHAPESREPAILSEFADWRAAHSPVQLDITLVRGNHDLRAGDPPQEWGLRCVDEGEPLGPFTLLHDPANANLSKVRDGIHGYCLAGHIHPVVTLDGPGGRTERAPCFWIGEQRAVLPAFGGFTGGGRVSPRHGDRVFVVGDGSVIEMRTRATPDFRAPRGVPG